MKRERAIDLLRRHEREFRDAGVGALYLFGSVARGQANEKSDVDVFFDLDRPRGFTLFSLVALKERMQDVLGAKVDLMSRAGIHPRRRARIESDAVRVF
jgi:predicted nucleotidyltransferase